MKILEGHAPGSLEWRKKITATKACAILAPVIGYKAFGSPLSVWADVTAALRGEESPDIDSSFMEWGRLTEPLNREILSRELGSHIQVSPGLVQDAEFDWLASTPDGIVSPFGDFEGDGVVELKSPSLYKRDDWEAAVPHSVLVQIMVNLRTTGLGWGVASAFMPPRKDGDAILLHETVERSEPFLENVIEVLQDFWEKYVCKDRMPPATGSDEDSRFVSRFFQNPEPATVDLSEEVAALVEREQELGVTIRESEKERKGIQNRIKQEIADNECGRGGGYIYSWRKQTSEYNARPAETRTTRVLRSKRLPDTV